MGKSPRYALQVAIVPNLFYLIFSETITEEYVEIYKNIFKMRKLLLICCTLPKCIIQTNNIGRVPKPIYRRKTPKCVK